MLAAQDAAEGLTDEDGVPELSEIPVSVAGDLWILGNQRDALRDWRRRVREKAGNDDDH